MDRPFRPVAKSLAFRLLELVRALQVIADSLKSVQEGRVHHLASLSGQLRALLTERSKQAEPLLLSVAKIFGDSLDIYCMPDVDDPTFPAELRKKTLLHVAGFPITTRQQFPAQRKLAFSSFLDQPIILYKGNKYTSRKLIEWYANWAGGAHYSRHFPEDFAELLAFNPMGLQPIGNLLVQIGQATVTLGRTLLKSLTDIELHVLLVVPQQSLISDTAYLFDAMYPGTAMRISLVLNRQLIPSFFVRGLQGTFGRADADRLMDWTAPRPLQASVTIEQDLATTIAIAIDGEEVGHVRVPEPLFVLSDLRNYEFYQNKAADGAPQEFRFGEAGILMFDREMAHAERARLLLYFEDQRTRSDLQLILFEPGSYAFSAQGTKDLAMTGNVVQTTGSTVLPDFKGHVSEVDTSPA
jgi:hypothetical protein